MKHTLLISRSLSSHVEKFRQNSIMVDPLFSTPPHQNPALQCVYSRSISAISVTVLLRIIYKALTPIITCMDASPAARFARCCLPIQSPRQIVASVRSGTIRSRSIQWSSRARQTVCFALHS